MKDQLKDYIDQNRESFEVYKLELNDAWSAIEGRLGKRDQRFSMPWKNLLKVAATLLLLISITFGYYMNKQRIDFDRYGIALQDVSTDLAETEAFYTMQIDEKLSLIKLQKEKLDSELLQQMETFDADYQVLKKDLKENADSEEVINAMIEHYRLKLALLEKIFSEIEKDNVIQDYDKAKAI